MLALFPIFVSFPAWSLFTFSLLDYILPTRVSSPLETSGKIQIFILSPVFCNLAYFAFLASICCSSLWCSPCPVECLTAVNLLNSCLSHLVGLWDPFCLWGSEFWEKERYLEKRTGLQLQDTSLERGLVHLLLCVTWSTLEVGKVCEDSIQNRCTIANLRVVFTMLCSLCRTVVILGYLIEKNNIDYSIILPQYEQIN